MPQGIKIWGPDGNLWFDTNDLTTRVSAFLQLQGQQVVAGSSQDQFGYHFTYTIVAGTTPWIQFGVSGAYGLATAQVEKINDTTARVTYYYYDQTAGSTISYMIYGFG